MMSHSGPPKCKECKNYLNVIDGSCEHCLVERRMKEKDPKFALAMALVRRELIRATEKFGPFNSSHEGWAVMYEEVEELWNAVKTNSKRGLQDESIQVAAMAVRFIMDICMRDDDAKK